VKENEDARRLTTIPGIGDPLLSRPSVRRNALTAAAISPHGLAWFRVGSPPAASRSSKRGNKYLRRQLTHGARAALPYVAERHTPLGRWAKELSSRAHRNVVSSPSPTSRRGSPGRGCDTQKGSPPQERRWRA